VVAGVAVVVVVVGVAVVVVVEVVVVEVEIVVVEVLVVPVVVEVIELSVLFATAGFWVERDEKLVTGSWKTLDVGAWVGIGGCDVVSIEPAAVVSGTVSAWLEVNACEIVSRMVFSILVVLVVNVDSFLVVMLLGFISVKF
jgi:hypothetical protein